MKVNVTKWNGHPNYECTADNCGFATLERGEIEAHVALRHNETPQIPLSEKQAEQQTERAEKKAAS